MRLRSLAKIVKFSNCVPRYHLKKGESYNSWYANAKAEIPAIIGRVSEDQRVSLRTELVLRKKG